MQAGDLVRAIHMPHLGIGHIEWVALDTRLVVTFEVDGRRYCDEFDKHELEQATPLKTG